MKKLQHRSLMGFVGFCALVSAAIAYEPTNQSNTAKPYFKTGFYGGAAMGYATDRLYVSNQYDGKPNGGTQQMLEANPTSNTLTGDIVFGGRILLKNGFMPGFDITVSTIRSKWDIDFPFNDFVSLGGPPLHVKVEKSYSVTPALVLGGIINEKYYIFSKLGVSISRVHTTISDRESSGGKNSQAEFLLGYSVNLGLEYAINDQLSVMGIVGYESTRASEYTSRSLEPQTIGTLGRDIDSNKIYTTTYTQKIGLIYKF